LTLNVVWVKKLHFVIDLVLLAELGTFKIPFWYLILNAVEVVSVACLHH